VEGESSGGAISFASVYAEYFEFVWICTRRLGVDADAIDDVVQEVFIVIHRRLETVERPDALRSWIYGVVRRTVSTHRRNQRLRRATGTEDPPGVCQPTPQELAEQTEEMRLLWSLLGQLDEAKREVFMLAELEEMTVPEIAQAVGIPLNTAYSRLRLARAEFDKALARHIANEANGGRPCRS
jgi:RNA polymerase sigma-70 factor (ECF subfamily)